MMANHLESIKDFFAGIIKLLGYSLDDPHFKDTPERYFKFIKGFERKSIEDILSRFKNFIFLSDYNEIICLRDISFFSLCEHHALPFFGIFHIAYLPKGKIIGISKCAEIVELISKRLCTQEELTQIIAESLFCLIKPKGLFVICIAQHTCLNLRKKQGSKLVTTATYGNFPKEEISRLLKWSE
jgi:GTP cyclohydrolase I